MIHPLQPQFSYTPDREQAKVALSLFGILVCSSTTVGVGLAFKFQLFSNSIGAGLLIGFLCLGFLAICLISLRSIHRSSQEVKPFKSTFTIEEV